MKSRLKALLHKKIVKVKGYSKRRKIITIVALVELLALMTYVTYSWVEMASSLEIRGENLSTAGTPFSGVRYYKSDVSKGTIHLEQYFDSAAGVHLQPASSSNGTNMFFETKSTGTAPADKTFRLGNVNDKNVSYVSFGVHVMAMDAHVALGFVDEPVISVTDIYGNIIPNGYKAIRVMVSDGTTSSIFAKDADQTVSAITSLKSDGTINETATQQLADFSDYVISPTSNPVITLSQSADTLLTVTVWLEGQDASCTDALAGCFANIDFTLGTNTTLSDSEIHFVDGTASQKFSSNNVYYSTNGEDYYQMTQSGTGSYDYIILGLSPSTTTIYFRCVASNGVYEYEASGKGTASGTVYYYTATD